MQLLRDLRAERPRLDPEQRSAYRAYLTPAWLSHGRLSIFLAAILMVAFSPLDHMMYPEHFVTFLWLRIIVSVVSVLLFEVSVRIDPAWAKHAAFVAMWLVTLGIMTMIVMTDPLSPYYAGLQLTIVGSTLMLPTTFRESYSFSTGVAVLYVGQAIWADPHNVQQALFWNNVFFIATNVLIVSYTAFFRHAQREREFLLGFQLESRNRALAEIDRRKTEFFAHVSHELRTPLTLILAPLDDVMRRGDTIPASVREVLNLVRANALRLLRYVNMLLDVARLQEGVSDTDREHEPDPIDLSAYVTGIAASFQPLAQKQHLDLVARVDAGVVVRADLIAIEKILFNLLGNAIKFTPEGGRVAVVLRALPEVAALEVTDTGIGIPKEHQSEVFQPFRQFSQSYRTVQPGTGLGLAIVKGLVDEIGGVIAIDSEPGAGTTVSLRIPLCNDLTRERGTLVALPEVLNVEALDIPSLDVASDDLVEPHAQAPLATLMIVDDEPHILAYLATSFASEYRVLPVSRGDLALDLAQTEQPQLILLDWMLPGVDGLEVCRRLRATRDRPAPKILMVTARSDEASKIEALRAGADDFIAKPFSFVEIASRLHNLLASATLERELAARNQQLEETLSDLSATQDRLLQSERLNTLGALSAGLLHEINNPLNYTLTALRLLTQDPVVEADADILQMIADAIDGAERIEELVKDLATFAYPDASQTPEAVGVAEVVATTARYLKGSLQNIALRCDCPPEAKVLVVRHQIVQVLVNLFSNAAAAIARARRQGVIQVSCLRSGNRLVIEVMDNGAGIPPGQHAQVFAPFVSMGNCRTHEPDAPPKCTHMGLGLTISQLIVANHGGYLRAVTPASGEGAILRFDLPIALESAPHT